MVKKPAVPPPGAAPAPDWDPSIKDVWHLDFEREPVNDDKWSCIVTAAIPAEAEDEECIQFYSQCVNTGLRKALKIISMVDVVELLTGTTSVTDNQKSKPNKGKTEKPQKVENVGGGDFKPLSPRPNQIVGLAAKYATFTDFECRLPSDLMAAVIKYLILNLKDENCFLRRVEAAKARKKRERLLKAKFIRSLKPYEISGEERPFFSKVPPNILELEEPINDQPINGPDLYILLTGFYDLFCFQELARLKVPLLALLRVDSLIQEKEMEKSSLTFVMSRTDAFVGSRKTALLAEFWESLRNHCMALEGTKNFKDLAMLSYYAPNWRNVNSKHQYLLKVFNELTRIQYSVYDIHRQHQIYLRELCVQRVIMSLEPLALDKCEVYNKICDILITGQPLTPALVLYAIIEQVVAGVPETESVAIEYKPQSGTFETFIASKSESVSVRREDPRHPDEMTTEFTTPCAECRDKIGQSTCEKLQSALTSSVKNNRTHGSEETSASPFQNEECLPEISTEKLRNEAIFSKDSEVCEMLDKVLAERKADKHSRKDKRWKAPDLYFHGDNVSLQMYHCDPRILTSETLIKRFLRSSEVLKVWAKYPKLSPEERTFFSFHFSSLRKISKEREESLKLKIHFTVAMKLLGAVRSYLYRGLEKHLSEAVVFFEKDKMSKVSRVKFEQNLRNAKRDGKNFSNSFFKPFFSDMNSRMLRRQFSKLDENRGSSLIKPMENKTLWKNLATFSMSFLSHHGSGTCTYYKQSDALNSPGSLPNVHNTTKLLSSLLDLPEISNLNEHHFLGNKNDYLQLTGSFKYYETLHPHVMVQRLLEAEENYNVTQYSYFTTTDSVIIVMTNDFDHRGVFYTLGTGVITTPVSLRDFYNYVHSSLFDWLLGEEETYFEFISSLKEKAAAEEEKQDEVYLTQLKREYCEMSPERKKEFIETGVDLQSEPEVTEEELGELPIKPKFAPPRKVSFVATNLVDVRVECKRQVNEFYSHDGLEVNVITDKWLYEPSGHLMLVIKRPKLRLYYHQCLGDESVNTAFTLKTSSDIIFAFYKGDAEGTRGDFNYRLNVSWPTGLMLHPVPSDSGFYIKQGYLGVYRSGWDIAEEKYRCYLKSGQVLVFKENGDMDILCGNGTKYSFYESSAVPRYEIISTTGEVWEVRTKGPCRFRKKLRASQKIFIGTDPTTQETYYRREDGVNCMLWPNGRLVTTYSDGTKITSTPYFDAEVGVEWSEEEKLYFTKADSKQKTDVSDLGIRTTFRNSSGARLSESSAFMGEAFVSVSCSYLMEHPKYSTVFFNAEEPCVTLTMPQNLKLLLHPGGNYEVHQERHVLKVQSSTVEFFLTCADCGNRSGATLNFDDEEILCKIVDFFRKGFIVNRTGKVTYQETFQESDEINDSDNLKTSSKTTQEQCINQHTKNLASNQRCFVLNRDLSGVEFLHVDSLAYDCYELPDDTYFDLHTDDPPNISHTFSSPYCRVGYENWVMDYEDRHDSLPTNLRKKDLKELGVKDSPDNSFKYPFPKHHNCSELQVAARLQKCVNMPKVTVARTVKCLSPEPNSVIENMHKQVRLYQKRVRGICAAFADKKVLEEVSQDQEFIQMRLKKIALTLNQSLKMYPHLCTQSPSTEKDIHYFGHFIQLMEEFKPHTKDEEDLGLDCKQIPKPLPRSSAFLPIREENELT